MRFRLLVCLILFLSSTGCDLIKEESTPNRNASVTDITISGYTNSALIILNTSVALSNTQSLAGNLPTSISQLSLLQQTLPNPATCLSGSAIYPLFFRNTPQRQGHFRLAESDIESLTEADTAASFKTFDLARPTSTRPITINAVLQYAGSKCLIYVETGIDYLLIKNPSTGAISQQDVDWSTIGRRFDDSMYPRETNYFGAPYDVDHNNKVIILYYAFNRGSLDETSTTGFIAGYFFPGDLVPIRGYYSNRKDMLYMNILSVTVTQNMETMAHEFQHLLTYSERVIRKNLPEFDTWINEGMAECGAHIGLNTPLYSQIARVKTDHYIRNGITPLFEWSSTAQQYALVYTFLQYIKNQSIHGESLFESIADSPYGDYRSISTLLTSETGTPFTSFKSIIESFHIANVVNQPTGPFGYKNDPTFVGFGNLPPPSLSLVTLSSGGAVYFYPSKSDLQNFNPKNFGNNISYYRINP